MTFWPFCFGLTSLLLTHLSGGAVQVSYAGRFTADTLSPSVESPGRPDSTRSGHNSAISVARLPAESYMIQRVAFVGDFLKRLNYEHTPDNKPFDASSRALYSREQAIRLLFDAADPRLSARSGRDAVYGAKVEDFVQTILDDTTQTFLPPDTEQLFAEVGYSILYKNAPQSVRFFLRRFHQNGAYDWKILDAEALFLKPSRAKPTSYSRRDSSLYIGSETHETRFLNLYNHLEERHNLLGLVPADYPVSPTLAALAEAFQNGSATVQQTQQVHLYLDTRRGWTLRLDDIERQKENSGWLITDLYPIHQQKTLPPALVQYMNRTHHSGQKTK